MLRATPSHSGPLINESGHIPDRGDRISPLTRTTKRQRPLPIVTVGAGRGSLVALNSDDFVTVFDLQRRYMSRCRGSENAYRRPPSTMPARTPTTGIGEGGSRRDRARLSQFVIALSRNHATKEGRVP